MVETKLTVTPPSGAGPLKVSVTVAVEPDTTEVGSMASEDSVTPEVAGVTVTVALWLAPPVPAVTFTAVEAVTGPAFTAILALVCPAGTV